MSKDDSSSGPPVRKSGEEELPTSPTHRKTDLPASPADDDAEENGPETQMFSSGLRLIAWLVALVLLLTILGWALGGGQ